MSNFLKNEREDLFISSLYVLALTLSMSFFVLVVGGLEARVNSCMEDKEIQTQKKTVKTDQTTTSNHNKNEQGEQK